MKQFLGGIISLKMTLSFHDNEDLENLLISLSDEAYHFSQSFF